MNTRFKCKRSKHCDYIRCQYPHTKHKSNDGVGCYCVCYLLLMNYIMIMYLVNVLEVIWFDLLVDVLHDVSGPGQLDIQLTSMFHKEINQRSCHCG